MMTRDGSRNRDQVEFTSLDELVPENHPVRKLENAIDWSFIYEMVEESYCEDNGRPSLDPVILIKLPMVKYMFGIRSMRQTIQEIKVNTAYRWFLGLGLHDPVPHFSTFGKNCSRRFKDDYQAEIIKIIRGQSRLPAEMLNDLIEKTKAQLEVMSENYIESERYLKEKQGNMATEQEEYKRLKSWADVYDKCSFEAKKMFISHFIKAIYVYRDYDLEIEFNVSFDEFKHFSAK